MSAVTGEKSNRITFPKQDSGGSCFRNRRKWCFVAAGLVGFVLLLVVFAWVFGYPAVVRWAVRKRLNNMEAGWNRDISVEKIEVGWGWVRLLGISVNPRGEKVSSRKDNRCMLLDVSSVKIRFEPFSLIRGKPRFSSVKISEPRFCLSKDEKGESNFGDILELYTRGDVEPHRSTMLDLIQVRGGSFKYEDFTDGTFVSSEHFSTDFIPGKPFVLKLRSVSFRKNNGPSGLADGLLLAFDLNKPGRERFHPDLEIEGGRISVHPKLFLTQIDGSVNPREKGEGIALDLTGAYAGASQKLWRASGWIDPANREMDIHLAADRFTLDKLSSRLKTGWGRAVKNPGGALLSGGIRFNLTEGLLRFEGALDVKGLNIKNSKIAADEISDLDFAVTLSGVYDPGNARIDIHSLDFNKKGVEVKSSVTVTRLHQKPRINARMEVERVRCSDLLDALPEAVFPHVKRLRVEGHFSMKVEVGVDFAYLTPSSVNLTGSVNHRDCRVIHAPEDLSASRLRYAFEHIAVDGSQVTKVWVGEENPDFVNLEMISPHVINSLLTTEDTRFFEHEGFIHREFRTALARNLIAGKFRYGASSISMQFVKNVMLNREKTLSRKLQELVLTAYIERHLEKERILEIYLNVIEFGPGIYGIGHAARHYFGKHALLIEPQEAAFLSTLLPSPKRRYRHFCNRQVTKRWRAWMDRILRLMYKRGRLTKEELETALETDLEFSSVEFVSTYHCMRRIKRYMQ